MTALSPIGDIRGRMASTHLDLTRGLAAIAVLVYHVRYRFFVDFADVESPGLLAKGFYTATAFGHDAVMVFFVLSGFLISLSVRRACQESRWTWRKYSADRLTRLYVVLFPALLLTLVWDNIGLWIAGTHPIYSGASQGWIHDYFNVADRINVTTLLGNVCFLQTIYVPPLGSNEPLWSLANEFWYYVLFPCAYLAATTRSLVPRIAYLVAAIASAILMGAGILAYLPVWLLGAVIGYLPLSQRLVGLRLNGALVVATGLFGACTIAGHVGALKERFGVLGMDYLTGIGFALLMYVMLHFRGKDDGSFYGAVAKSIAAFSFTLYVTHTPFLVCVRGTLTGDTPWQPSWFALAAAVLLAVGCIGYAALLARFTEARTGQVRGWVSRLVVPAVSVTT